MFLYNHLNFSVISFYNKQAFVKNIILKTVKKTVIALKFVASISNTMFIRKIYILLFVIPALFFTGFAQPDSLKISTGDYIEKYKFFAVREMLQTGIPASIILGQGILESESGNSHLSLGSNNHFGIKCHLDWSGETFIHDDDRKNECFRKYQSVEASYIDHSQFLLSRNWYKPLFELKTTDYKGWAKGLKKAGYATDKHYAEKLIKIIEENDLKVYDRALDISALPARNPHVYTPVHVPIKKSPITTEHTGNYEIQVNNERKFIVAKKGDSISKLAKAFEMKEWQFYKYNDLQKGDKLKAGEIVYLQPKRNHAKEDFHIVKNGEDIRSISQIYCVKLTKLYENNLMTYGSQPKQGEKIYLKRKKA